MCIDKSTGYKRIHLIDSDGKRRYVTLHRLLAQAFLPNPQQYKVVDHISRDKLDNSLNNLRWTTQSENIKNASGNGAFIDVLPKDCIEFKSYGAYMFTNYYIHSDTKQIYRKVIEYRVLNVAFLNGNDIFYL